MNSWPRSVDSFLTPINDGSRHNAARERPYRHRMGGLRQGSFAVRAAISVLALYALVLQAFLASSAPAAVFAFPGGIDAYQRVLAFPASIRLTITDFVVSWHALLLPALMRELLRRLSPSLALPRARKLISCLPRFLQHGSHSDFSLRRAVHP
jgi:hypothetical protein